MFNIFKASIKEIDEIVNLRIALQKEVGELTSLQDEMLMETVTKEYLEKALLNNDFICFMAEKDGEIVSSSGVVLFKRPPYLENLCGIEAYILNMYTIPEYRGKGLGTKLLKNCIEDCKKNGVKRIWLHASEGGKPVYKKQGFTFNQSEMELFL